MREYIDLNKIELTGNFIGDIWFKPTTPIYITFVFGVLCLFINNIWMRVLGILSIALVAFIYFTVKDHKTLSIYDDCIIVYKGENKAYKVPFADILEWNTNMTQQYRLYLKLVNGSDMVIETYRLDQADRLLRQVLGDKNSVSVIQRKTKGLHFSLSNPKKNIGRLIADIKKMFKGE